MVATMLREPRPGTGGAKRADFLRPGSTVTLVALAPEAGVSMAVLRWSNAESGGAKVLSPAALEIAALQELPLKPSAGDAPSGLDVEAAREAIQGELPAGGASADTPVLVYWKDSLTGAGGYAAEGGEAMLETLQRSHAALKQVGLVQALVYTWQVLQGMPTTGVGSVLSNAMSRTLGINNRNRKTEVALDTARAIFPQAADRLSSVAEHVGLANALLVAAHVIGAGVVKGEAAEESTATPSGAAAAAAAEGTEEMLTPTGRPRRKRAVTSYAESVSGEGSEGAVAEAAEEGEEWEPRPEGEGEGEAEGDYRPPKEKKPRAPRKRSAPKAPKPPSNFPKVPALAAAAPHSPAQSGARSILQMQQAAGVPGMAATATQPAAAGGGQGGGSGAVMVAPAPQLTQQQQQQLMAAYIWQLQQAMQSQMGYGGAGGGVGSPTAGGGLPASFPYAHALAQQPVLPVVGPAMGGGGSYGDYAGGAAGGYGYPSAYGTLAGSGQLTSAAAPAPLYGGLAATWPQLGGAALGGAATSTGPAADTGVPAARAQPAGEQAAPTAQQVLAAAQQAAEQAQQAQQAQRGLGTGLPGSVSDFLQ